MWKQQPSEGGFVWTRWIAIDLRLISRLMGAFIGTDDING